MEIVAGDIVQLKSGGPYMTVEWIEDGVAFCSWFDVKKQIKDRFQIVALTK
ncbi:YodC family protein [Sphingomonas sp.]|uniref:YodC family protein n=1 Tax=Sphingomonas sp. TaxID=28214 RepID=UPI002DD6809B|nr:DUF2158 domain-containing protein [Sphingomonas sp.]